MTRRRTKPRAKRENGIALFMVISSLALLSVLIAELTYSTQMNARLAYNYVDNLKAFYLAKTALKMSMVRLKAYQQIRTFSNDPANKGVKDALGKSVLDKIWSIPLIWPLPIPKEASTSEGDTVKKFIEESKLSGSYTAVITGESSKLNLNNLFIREVTPPPAGASGASGAPPPTSAPTPTGTPVPVDFRAMLEPTITNLIEGKKTADKEFADVYRNVNGKDVMDAIMGYVFPDMPPSNLPGYKQMKPKQAPFYSITELHAIPGLDDDLYKLLEGILTVYSTPGINVNTINKTKLMSMIPEILDLEADDLLRKRDDPEVGQPFGAEEDFWNAVQATSAGRNLQEVKDRFKKANLKIITDEESFKIGIEANVGLSTRRVEAYVILAKDAPKPSAPAGQPAGVNVPGQQDPSAKKPTGIDLIYWRMM